MRESSTTTLFTLTGLCVDLQNTELHGAVSKSNKAYEALVESKKAGGEGYKGQHAQTVNNPAKTKEIL